MKSGNAELQDIADLDVHADAVGTTAQTKMVRSRLERQHEEIVDQCSTLQHSNVLNRQPLLYL